MRRAAVGLFLLAAVFSGPHCCAQEDIEKVARAFLPLGAELAEFVKADPKTGKVLHRSPAVLAGRITGSQSRDIVFAYQTNAKDLGVRPLFVALAHKTESGYVKIFERTYYNRYLWSQDFSTVGLKLLSISPTQPQLVAIITAVGASLGATVEVFTWDEVQGLVNTMPGNDSVRHVLFSEDGRGPRVVLSFEKYPGEPGVPSPQIFRWDGHRLVKNR